MVKDRWTSGAEYERWMGRWSRLLAHKFLPWLDLPAGLRWLDLCCGSGIVTEAIADSCAPAHISAVDISPGQIEFAREHRSRPSITFETADAMSLPFPESSFDVAVCGLGLNFIPDPVRALEECRRVLRPGGTTAAYVWDYAGGARFIREFWDAALAVDAEAAAFDQARRFAICTQAALRDAFVRAQFEQITVRSLEIVTHFSSFEDYWTPLLTGQGSAPTYLAGRDEKTRAAICERLVSSLPRNPDGSIELPARVWAVRARSRAV